MRNTELSFFRRHRGVLIALVLEMALVVGVAGMWGAFARPEVWASASTPGAAVAQPSDVYGLAVNTAAPDFALRDAHADDHEAVVRLSELTRRAPVLLVFYRGYACPHCVTHLAAIDGRLEEFDKAGLQVVAISQDSVKETRESIAVHGDFGFPLLSDEGDQIAKMYGLRNARGEMLHGVFVIDQQGRVRLSEAGEEPFGDFARLLALGYTLQSELMKGQRSR